MSLDLAFVCFKSNRERHDGFGAPGSERVHDTIVFFRSPADVSRVMETVNPTGVPAPPALARSRAPAIHSAVYSL